jgi:hypothetical protein
VTAPHSRAENAVQILILLIVGGMAGAASFTHVHDWTMHNTPAGTGSWFGWANAIISELTPTAAGIEIRRRHRQHRTAAYPTAVLIAAVTLSLSAQVAQAKPGITGWLLAAVPALAFLALTKLILSRTTTSTKANQSCASAATPNATSAPPAENPTPTPTAAPAAATPTPDPLPAQLVTSAQMAAFAHRQATGQPITADGLAAHLNISPTVAGILLHHLDGTGITGTASSPVTAVNGTPLDGSRP